MNKTRSSTERQKTKSNQTHFGAENRRTKNTTDCIKKIISKFKDRYLKSSSQRIKKKKTNEKE